MAILPALTIWQPWATLIAAGCKPYEFRGWSAPYALQGRRIAIHAGARPVRKAEVRDLLLQLQSSSWRLSGLRREESIAILEKALLAPGSLPLSSILCTAVLGKPIRDDDLAAKLGICGIHDSDRGEHSSWGWPLDEVKPLIPFLPARGAQGFWNFTMPADTIGDPS